MVHHLPQSASDSSDVGSGVSSTPLPYEMITAMANGWRRRAIVCSRLSHQTEQPLFEDLPDFPIALVPFADHPLFLAGGQELSERVLSLAWLVYNQRTIAAEVLVANPAFGQILAGKYQALNRSEICVAVQQSVIDENFHTLMHMKAMEATRRFRGIVDVPTFPPSVTYRRLLRAQAEVSESWEKDLLTLVFAIVSEISINAHLSALACAPGIQPAHRRVAAFHNRDEVAHAKLLLLCTPILYSSFTIAEKRAFIRALPLALEAFVAHDYSAWEIILTYLRFEGSNRIIADCMAASNRRHLIRDYSGLQSLVRDLNLESEVGFDFGGNQ